MDIQVIQSEILIKKKPKKTSSSVEGKLSINKEKATIEVFTKDQTFCIPFGWLLRVDLKDIDVIVLHHVSRDEKDFYHFLVFEMQIMIPSPFDRQNVFQQLVAIVEKAKEKKPKKILVGINPKSGWGKGPTIFDENAKPLFDLAGIETEVVILERGGHFEDILMTKDLTEYDAILASGGDGTHYEAFNGVVKRMQKDAGIETDMEDPVFVKPSLTVGVLPTGSGNKTSLLLNMTHDIQSCVINIIIGNKRSLDLSSVHDSDKSFKLLAMVHCGVFFASLSADWKWVDNKRFLGPLRYSLFLWLFVSNLWRKPNRPKFNDLVFKSGASNGEVECQVSETNGNLGRCQNCVEHQDSIRDEQEAKHWEPFKGINLEFMTMAGFVPLKDKPIISGIKDTRIDLHLSDGLGCAFAGRFNTASFFKLIWCWYADISDSRISHPPYSLMTNATELKINLENPFPIHCDGEFNEDVQCVYLKVHRGLVEVFGSGTVEGHPNRHSITTVAKWRCRLVTFIFVLVSFLVFSIYAIITLLNCIKEST